ncbi:MAG: phosphoribosylanthranilate isomerase [Verrucomicrobiaceae bacterium]|nr:phosphoribosylanthranilate isomerase [Verrucomicrobiaceae bacterium]
MFGSTTQPAVKICGITRADQAADIATAGADALGINLWERSKRFVPLADATRWLPALRDHAFLVAVVVNPAAALLDEIIATKLFHAIQLHGDETPHTVAALMDRGVEVIKALQVRSRESLAAIAGYPTPCILLDSFNPGLYGGAGTAFPWELAREARDLYPDKHIILAGGLTPENVRSAVEQTHPHAVDVASGVESAPGEKDLKLVRRFIEEARPA